jgi:metallo-beta-lactamase family protein
MHAQIHTIGGFSAHAGQTELLAWHRQTGNPETTFLVHGEEECMAAFGRLLQTTRVEMPKAQQSYLL